MSAGPAVSVVTPFYNTADYLAECIESVLAQTFEDFEYVLADNRSTDGSREIAEAYAAQHSRIRFVHFDEHLPQLQNYNRALGLIHAGSSYVKMAQADDLLMPRCLEEMVTLADTDPEIVMVGAYALRQDQVALDGLDFSESVLTGDEVARRFLRGGPYLLGNPTTRLYRARCVRQSDTFYPPEFRMGDTHAALRLLRLGRFGFVHQVLTVCRRRPGSISAEWKQFGGNPLSMRVTLAMYGAEHLPEPALARERKHWRRVHYRVLARGILEGRPEAFWRFHREELAAAGLAIERWPLVRALLGIVGHAIVNPGHTAAALIRRLRRRGG